MAAELKAKNIPVILGPTLAAPLNEDDPVRRAVHAPGRTRQGRREVRPWDLRQLSSRATCPTRRPTRSPIGLPHEAGLEGDHALPPPRSGAWPTRYGSIDKGKWADLIVTDGDPLEMRTQVKQMFIQGRPVDLSNKHLRLYEKYRTRP